MSQNRAWSPADDAQLWELFTAGVTDAEIGARSGRTEAAVAERWMLWRLLRTRGWSSVAARRKAHG